MSEQNKKRALSEIIADAVLKSVTDVNSGESDDSLLYRGSIRPRTKTGDGSYPLTESGSIDTRVIFSQDYKSIYGGSLSDITFGEMINNCYTWDDGTVLDPQINPEYFNEDGSINVEYDSMVDEITLTNCISGTPIEPTEASNHTFTLPDINNMMSQYITFNTGSMDIDTTLGEQTLNTKIFELLPSSLTRQQRINRFFSEFYQLIGEIPEYKLDVDFDGIADTWNSEIEITSEQNSYSTGSDVTHDSEEGNIVRLNRHGIGTINESQTLQFLRDSLNTYLTDIDKKINPQVIDSRPEYVNRSDGFFKIRNLNQSIIVRNEQGSDTGLLGPDPENPNYLKDGFTVTMWVKFLDKRGSGTLFNFGNPMRSEVNNPFGFRLETYTLGKNEQLRPDRNYTWGEYISSHTKGSNYLHSEIDANLEYFSADNDFFADNDYERFVRLIVRENTITRESCTGMRQFKEGVRLSRIDITETSGRIPGNGEYPIIWPDTAEPEDTTYFPNRLLTYTRVPVDFKEWYFLCATYDPSTQEDASHDFDLSYAPDGVNTLRYFSEYWLGHVIPDGTKPTWNQILNNPQLCPSGCTEDNVDAAVDIGKYTVKSGYGNRCKVEFISRTNLLRARGFKTDSSLLGESQSSSQVIEVEG